MKFQFLIPLISITSSIIADSSCNPLTQSNCPSDPALSSSFKETFTSDLGQYFTKYRDHGDFTFSSDDGLSLTINERFDNPSIKSNFYIMFGHVEVVLKAASGQGIVSSFYLQSDDLDEIDIELFGGDPYQWQSNYFYKGQTGSYDRGGYHDIENPLENYHTYTIEWTKDSVVWSVDGQKIRELTESNSQGLPQSPMQIYAGIWAGGDPSNEPGTISWAGGNTDYSKAPFTMHIKSILVADYSSGKSYSYGNQSGSWESIEADGGSINGRYQQAQQDIEDLNNGQSVDSNFQPSSSDSESSSSSASSSTSSSSTSSSFSTSTPSSISTTSSSSSSSTTSSSSSSNSSNSVASTTSSSSSSSTTSSSSSSNSSNSVASTTSSTNAANSSNQNLVYINSNDQSSSSANQSTTLTTSSSSQQEQTTSSTIENSSVFISTEGSSSTTLEVNSNNGGSSIKVGSFLGFLGFVLYLI
ncbi:unnamed protein product [Candida verbasci]|uniref:Crh-like protein n=1 Tax=Candida verbasci TaxID=1227364 RepID=A0A9W4TYJ1_9ASCO|nr:unnamed protein product [Candida verbasci]